MDKQIEEELTKIYEQIGALLSTDESDKIKKFGTLQILGAAVPAPEKPYRKGDVLGYNGTDFGIGDTVPGKEITWLKLGDIWVCDRNCILGAKKLITTMRPNGRFAAITPRAATIAATRRPRTRSLVGAPSLKN